MLRRYYARKTCIGLILCEFVLLDLRTGCGPKFSLLLGTSMVMVQRAGSYVPRRLVDDGGSRRCTRSTASALLGEAIRRSRVQAHLSTVTPTKPRNKNATNRKAMPSRRHFTFIQCFMYEPLIRQMDGRNLHVTVLGIRYSEQDTCGLMQRNSISPLLHTHGRATPMDDVPFLATRSHMFKWRIAAVPTALRQGRKRSVS